MSEKSGSVDRGGCSKSEDFEMYLECIVLIGYRENSIIGV
jgi:hypothetical protein